MAPDLACRRGDARRRGAAARRRRVAAAEQQPVVRGPARIVIRPARVPQHHVGEPELAAVGGAERSRREHVGIGEGEAAGERLEVAGRVPGGDHDLPRVERPARRRHADALPRRGRCGAPAIVRRSPRRPGPRPASGRRRRGTDRSGRCPGCGCPRAPGCRPRPAARAASAIRPSMPARTRPRTRRAACPRRRRRWCSRSCRAARDRSGSAGVEEPAGDPARHRRCRRQMRRALAGP